jgi:hypothetical protein
MGRRTKPVYDKPIHMAEWQEAAGRETGATRPHVLASPQFDDFSLPADAPDYLRRPADTEEPKKPKYGDAENPLPPEGRSGIRPPKAPTPEQRTRSMVRTVKMLGRLAAKSKGRR